MQNKKRPVKGHLAMLFTRIVVFGPFVLPSVVFGGGSGEGGDNKRGELFY